MAEIRFNYGDKFTQTSDSNTGIGSTIPAAKLDVAGGTSAGSLRVSGIATLSSYQGFVNTKISTTEDLIIEAGQSGSVSGEVVVGTGQTISVSTGATTGQGGIQSLNVYETFMPPVGGTADRPTDVKPGMVYYNKDFKTIEFWDGNFWKQVDNTTTSGRALIAGGNTPKGGGYSNIIQLINIHTFGDARRFGDLLEKSRHTIATSNSIRGLMKHGYVPGGSDNDIEYATIASEGNAINFGDATYTAWGNAFVASSTRGVLGGGVGAVNTICYVQIMTTGNAIDFGDLSVAMRHTIGYSSPTRGIIGTGDDGGSPGNNISNFDSLTIASTGNAIDFGDAGFAARAVSACSNTTRGVWMGGYFNTPRSGGSVQKQVTSTTIASGGQASDFGNLLKGQSHSRSASSHTRAVDFGGNAGPAQTQTIEFIEFASGGNAQHFGELQDPVTSMGALSDCHGGLGGF